MRQKLIEMNPFVQIEFCQSIAECEKVSVVVTSISSFKEAQALNDQLRTLPNKPAFYGVNTSGLYGFAFIDFGSDSVDYEFN